jgi:hypothetical protein
MLISDTYLWCVDVSLRIDVSFMSYTYAFLFYRQTPRPLALNIRLLDSHTRHLLLSIYHLFIIY